jgi:serine/tyrosine/threonine adenylyltransferase
MKVINLEIKEITSSFSGLSTAFYTQLHPTPLSHPYLIDFNTTVCDLIGFNPSNFQKEATIELLTGNAILENFVPYSAVYSGHQFGQWAGQLGDGRAITVAEVKTQKNELYEIQLKGAGLTPYSRMGDGRAVLRSSIREYLCSEAMFSLGIPTSRALSITGSKDEVYRERVESAAVVTRIAPTFIRFGSFEHWYYKEDIDHLKELVDFTISNFYPEIADSENRYLQFLEIVVKRTAELIAQWQSVGFMHGVMNTDNMSILGLTLDYGPFGFMEAFHPGHICNHSDHQGRYSYTNQPFIGQWNCSAFAQTLTPLIDDIESINGVLAGYIPIYRNKWDDLFHAKLGLNEKHAEDKQLLDELFKILEASNVDFTIFFRKLATFKQTDEKHDSIRDLFIDRIAFDDWSINYKRRLKKENSDDELRSVQMNAINPKYILRNYLLQNAIDKATQNDFSEVKKLKEIMSHPFDEQPENEKYAALPPDWAQDLIVSCSS